MIIPSRALLTVALAGCLFCILAPWAGQEAMALSLRGTVFAGSVTCTRDFSYTFTVRHETDTLVEHGQTTYTLTPGEPIQGDATYSYRFTKDDVKAATGEEDTTVQTIEGTFAGPTGRTDDYRGFELGTPGDLALGLTRVPATQTVEQTRTLQGRVVNHTITSGQVEEDYPVNGAPPPLLTITAGKAQVSGSRTQDLHGPNGTDTRDDQLDGHAECTWSLVVVLFNGQPFPPAAAVPQVLQCSPVPMPSVAPAPPPEAGNAVKAAHRDAEASHGASQAGARIAWRTLRWSDFKGKVPPPSSTLAETYSGLGAAVGYTTTGLCDPASRTYTYTATYTLGDEHAFFDQGKSWGSARLTAQPESADSTNVLNHEQRHFDISEVYSRIAHTELLKLLGGNPVHTFTCPKPAACIARITALYQRLRHRLQTFIARKDATQALYDLKAGRIDLTGPQAEWNTKIDGWLSAPETAP